MYPSLLRSALTFLHNKRSYTLVNLFGLTLSLIATGLIFMYLQFEYAHDQFHSNSDSLYRLIQKPDANNSEGSARNPYGIKDLLDKYPSLENQFTRIIKRDASMAYRDQRYVEDDVYFVDPTFLKMFDFRLLEGDVETALEDPYKIILTESMVQKYFGQESPLGKQIRIYEYDETNEGALYQVTGVVQDPPIDSHLTFNFLSSFKTPDRFMMEWNHDRKWDYDRVYYYFNSEAADLEVLLPMIAENESSILGLESPNSYALQKFESIYLGPDLDGEIGKKGNVQRLWLYFIVGLMILFLAFSNFLNLTFSILSYRQKEAGMKRLLGQNPSQMSMQFILESNFISLFSGIASMIIILSLFPFIQTCLPFAIKDISIGVTLVFLVLTAILIGMVTGMIPGIWFRQFSALTLLKTIVQPGRKFQLMRNALVVFQFSISIFLLIMLGTVQDQLSFIENRDLGFEADGVELFKVNGSTEVIEGFQNFKNDLLGEPDISAVSRSNSSIGGGLDEILIEAEGINGPLQLKTFELSADEEFLKAYGIPLLTGRIPQGGPEGNELQVLVNESFGTEIGYSDPQDLLAMKINYGRAEVRVVGVVKDFHFDDLYKDVGPLVVFPVQERFSMISIKSNSQDQLTTAKMLEAKWKEHFPNSPLDNRSQKDRLANQYMAPEVVKTSLRFFSVLSLVISSIGLIGISFYLLIKQRKEVVLRKIFGASQVQIFRLMVFRILTLVIASCGIGIPIALLYSSYWLDAFAYRAPINWENYLLAGSLLLLVALLSVSFQTFKAISVNPAQSFRES